MIQTFPIAHGVLGPYDEIILPILGLIFIAALVLTWFRSRQEHADPPIETHPDKRTDSMSKEEPDDDSHFRLD